MSGVPRVASTALLAVWLMIALVACSGGDATNGRVEEGDPDPGCSEARPDSFPYTLCLPNGWTMAETTHPDGSVDIVLSDPQDGTNFGFAKTYGIVGPDGRLNRYQGPAGVKGWCADLRRIMTEAGSPAVECKSSPPRPIRVDGHRGWMADASLDDARALTARIRARGETGVNMIFVWDPAVMTADQIEEVVMSLRFDDEQLDEQIGEAGS